MRMRPTGALAALLPALMALGPTPARADAIDGNWCSREGRHLAIQGPAITTPGGRKTTGTYDRHAFSYVIPAPEPQAGETVFMTLRGENLMTLRVGTASDGAPQEWRRCSAPTS